MPLLFVLQMAQEIGFKPKDADYINPYKKKMERKRVCMYVRAHVYRVVASYPHVSVFSALITPQ